MRISHNLLAQNAQNNLKTVTGRKSKSVGKLSSGYRINRAADDAAGLAISEKMRRQIRGLNKGSENVADGISWSQIGDGALGGAHDILHRMTELTIKSLNETNSDSDRMALEQEFEHLQSELDRISVTTTFNEINIFEQHEIPYYQCEGDVKWDPHQMHVVKAGKNDLTFTYREKTGDAAKSVTFNIPPGEYTTQELIDEIDNLTAEFNEKSDVDLILEFDQRGYCNANLEGGEVLDCVSGNMSYLLYQMFRGGGYGALIGTTSFPYEDSELEIVTGQNDSLKFTIQNLQGPEEEKEVTIPAGWYTRQDLIDYLNQELDDTTVRADAYGSGIRLASEDAIVTGFKGNMFKIDGNGVVYNSVFYDNVKYGEVIQKSAEFTGGYVLPTDVRDVEHKYYRISSLNGNNELTLQPSGFDAPITLTIPDGEYTATQMENTLNTLFQQNNITTLTANKISSNGFEGLKITASDKGLESKINIDENSSAYNTLFRIKEYNSYTIVANPVSDSKSDTNAYFLGSKELSQLATTPLKIEAGKNDQFHLKINGGNPYTITLTAGTYYSAEDVRAEIDAQLNGVNAAAGYKGMIEVTLDGGRIKLTGTGINGQGSTETLTASAIQGNEEGYNAIFQGYNVSTSASSQSGRGSITLNTPYDQAEGIDSSESQMKIEVDGKSYDVNLPTGNPTTDEIKAAIENTMQGEIIETNNTFTAVSATGSSTDCNFNRTAVGSETINAWSGSAQGTSDQVEGIVQSSQNTPAVLTIGVALNDSMVVGDYNNQITLTIKGKTEVITLESGVTYTKETLKDTLQQKIDEVFGTGRGSATVSLNGNYLVLTSRLQSGENGKSNTISCSTDNSSFLRELRTQRTAAVWTSANPLNSSMVITADNKEFTFQYTENGITNDVTITLTEGTTYTRDSFKQAVNDQLTAQGIGVTADISNNCLRLTSDKKGNDVKISYSTANGENSAETLFGPLTRLEPARIVTGCDVQSTISISAGVNDSFTITVNGQDHTVTLTNGDYNPSSFLAMLNTKLSPLRVKASLDGNWLAYETVDKGAGVSLAMSYGNGGSSMKAIYGVSQQIIPPVKVSFDTDGKMTLSTMDGNPNSMIKVNSATGGPFQQAIENKTPISVSSGSGYHSTQTSYIDGEGWNGDVIIDQWNNTLNFSLYENGNRNAISIEVPNDIYTYSQLQAKLKELIEAKAGTGKLNITVNANGVRLETTAKGKNNRIDDFSGDFYDKVIGRTVERRDTVGVTAKEGTQIIDSAFTVGRKDVKNKTTRIQGGISDELNLDLTYGQNTYTLSMKLDGGAYTGEQLKRHLQEKVNEQLLANNLPEYLVEVGIGGVSTGVYGSNDSSALNFSLSNTIPAPSEGKFLLDGVSGSAAFEIFYQTDGSLEQAYIVGTKDISRGITISSGEDELSILVDGVTYDISIPAGTYTAEEFKTVLNKELKDADVPVTADIVEGKVKLIHNKMGEHEIRDVSGSAASNVFFSENGRKNPKDENYVKLSSSIQKTDRISLDRPVLNTCSLKLNSVCITKEKYAKKALERIEDALEIVSNIRSNFGSTQNRLEHALRNNQNTEENLQVSESRIRDADMAKEMVALSNFNILQQAGQAMLAQANQINEGVLALLR